MRSKAKVVGWSFTDQAASTLSNLIPSLVVSHFYGADGLGAYAFAFTSYLIILGLNRALLLDPLITLEKEESLDETLKTDVTGITILAGLISFVLIVLIAVLLDKYYMLVLAVTITGLLLQDSARYMHYRNLAARRAARLNLAWLAISIGALIAAIAGVGPTGIIAIWAIGGAVPGHLAARPTRDMFSVRRMRGWRRLVGGYSLWLLADSIMFLVTNLVSQLVLTARTSEMVLARLRVVQTYTSAAQPVFSMVNLIALPRLTSGTKEKLVVRCVWISAGLGLLSLAGYLALLAFGKTITAWAFGAGVVFDSSLAVPLGGIVVAQSAAIGATLMGRVIRRAGPQLFSRALSGVLGLAGSVWAVSERSSLILAYSMLAQSLVFCLSLWIATLWALSRNRNQMLAVPQV